VLFLSFIVATHFFDTPVGSSARQARHWVCFFTDLKV
jgi:hypothetical protein